MRNMTVMKPSDRRPVESCSVYKYSHSVSDLRELLREVLAPLMEDVRAARLQPLEVASSFSSWKTGGHAD